MVSLASLWLPILLGAVAVFFVSSLVHMVFKWHNAHYLRFANEDEVRAAVRKGATRPGHYVVPFCLDGKDMQTPEMQQKYRDGPIGHFFVAASGVPSLGAHLGKWFALTVGVALLSGYVASRALDPGAGFGDVLRIVWTAGLLAYGAGPVMDGIWHARPGREVALDLLDALLYGAAMALPFALLWPAAS
jgi:hypothetical protein